MTEANTGGFVVTDYYAYDDVAPARVRPRRRRGRFLPILLSLIVILAVIAVVADRVAASYATKELRTKMVSQLSQMDVQYDSLDVSIGGFPFLTQVARGNYDKITIDMTNVRLPEQNGRGATLPSLNVVATGVDADTQQVIAGTAKVNAEKVTGTAVVSFSTLDTIVDYSKYQLKDVKYSASDGGLHATGKLDLGAVELPISATADISVVNGQFQVKLRDLKAVNVTAPTAAKTYLTNLAQQSISAQLPKLPFGLALDHVTVGPDGLAISAIGQNVPLLS
jgi:hypothetical protein